MGRTLENKQQIVTEIKSLLNDSEMAVVLDYKGLTIKEMSDLRSRLQTTNGICKVTKNSLMRKAIDGDSNRNDLESLLTGTNAFVLIKEEVGGAVKAIQSFQKDTKKSETKGALLEGRLLSDSEKRTFLLRRQEMVYLIYCFFCKFNFFNHVLTLILLI